MRAPTKKSHLKTRIGALPIDLEQIIPPVRSESVWAADASPWVDLLSESEQNLFAADCIDSIRPLYEAARPGDRTILRAIHLTQAYALGAVTRDQAARTIRGLDGVMVHIAGGDHTAFGVIRAARNLVIGSISDLQAQAVICRAMISNFSMDEMEDEYKTQRKFLLRYIQRSYGEATVQSISAGYPDLEGSPSDIVMATIIREDARRALQSVRDRLGKKRLSQGEEDALDQAASAFLEITDASHWIKYASKPSETPAKKANFYRTFWQKLVGNRHHPEELKIPRKPAAKIGASPKSHEGKMRSILLQLEQELRLGAEGHPKVVGDLLVRLSEIPFHKIRGSRTGFQTQPYHERIVQLCRAALEIPYSRRLSDAAFEAAEKLLSKEDLYLAHLANPMTLPQDARFLISRAEAEGFGKRAWMVYQRNPASSLHALEDPDAYLSAKKAVPVLDTPPRGYTYQKLDEALDDLGDQSYETQVPAEGFERGCYETDDGALVYDRDIQHPGVATLKSLMDLLEGKALLMKPAPDGEWIYRIAEVPRAGWMDEDKLMDKIRYQSREGYLSPRALSLFLRRKKELSDSKGSDAARKDFLEEMLRRCHDWD